MINTLEDIGVISRRSIYEIAVDDKPLIKSDETGRIMIDKSIIVLLFVM
ncbi:MAG: hypothetical protein ACLRMX_05790 [Lachnospira eligens]